MNEKKKFVAPFNLSLTEEQDKFLEDFVYDFKSHTKSISKASVIRVSLKVFQKLRVPKTQKIKCEEDLEAYALSKLAKLNERKKK